MAPVVSRIGWVIAVVSVCALAGCSSPTKGPSPKARVALWNGEDFAGWHRYVAESVDVNNVWRIHLHVLHCTGKPDGYMRTVEKYKNYRLHVEWRWPQAPGNSGILLHMNEPEQLWPTCIECQLKAGSAGDFVLMNGATLTVNRIARQNPTKQFVVVEKRSPTSEKPAGQWNICEIQCDKGTIRCTINGVLQNEGIKAKPNLGWIGLQSEGTPIEFRNIYLLPAD